MRIKEKGMGQDERELNEQKIGVHKIEQQVG